MARKGLSLFVTVVLVVACTPAIAGVQHSSATSRALEDELLEEVAAGDIDAVRKLLKEGVSANAADEDGATALMYAARDGDLELVRLLVANGADPRRVGCLHWHEEGKEDWWTGSALHAAAGGGHMDVVRYLVGELGMDVDTQPADCDPRECEGRRTVTPLLEAAFSGRVAVMRYLLKHGADVNARDNCGRTAMHHAAYSGSADAIRLLLEHGADVDARAKDGYTPLHVAAFFNHVAAAKALLQGGADREARDSRGRTAWDRLKEDCSDELLSLLAVPGAEKSNQAGGGEATDALVDDEELNRIAKEATAEEIEEFRKKFSFSEDDMDDEEVRQLYALNRFLHGDGDEDQQTVEEFLESLVPDQYPAAPAPETPVMLRWDFHDPKNVFAYRIESESSGGLWDGLIGNTHLLYIVRSRGDGTADVEVQASSRDDGEGADSGETEDQPNFVEGLMNAIGGALIQGMGEDSTLPEGSGQQRQALQDYFPVPNQELQVGQTATIERSFPFNAMGSLLWVRGSTKITLKDFVYVDGHRCAELEVATDISKIDAPKRFRDRYDAYYRARGVAYFDLEDRCFAAGKYASVMSVSAGLDLDTRATVNLKRVPVPELPVQDGTE